MFYTWMCVFECVFWVMKLNVVFIMDHGKKKFEKY